MEIITTPPTGLGGSDLNHKFDKISRAAADIEAQFLATLLKSGGLGVARTHMGGGAGEEQFSSFLVEAQAKKIAENSGLGIAEAIYAALIESESHNEKSG